MVNKCAKRFELMQRETRASGNKLPPASAPRPGTSSRPSAGAATGGPPQQKYALGLSLGPSSTALLHMLHEHLRNQRQRGGRGMRWDVVAVHVVDGDGDAHEGASSGDGESGGEAQGPALSARDKEILERYRARFPEIEIRTVSLQTSSENEGGSEAALLPWSSPSSPSSPAPSATSRADVRRLLTRRALLAAAARLGCDVLLLGHSTTALAELTLSETAKGRGFALPWLVNDGSFPVPPVPGSAPGMVASSPSPEAQQGSSTLPVYHPLRELFRKELLTYAALSSPPLTELLPESEQAPLHRSGNTAPAVVSHRDLSIDDVMARFFGEVEASYPSVVANVVRTTGKLVRRGGGEGGGDRDEGADDGEIGEKDAGGCGLCGVPLDKTGDERWRGEIGEDLAAAVPDMRRRVLCYGCERTTRG